MNQRTKLMYSESRGFYYEADLSAVSDAREELRKAQLDKTIYDLEKQIKVLEESMKNETDAIDEQIKKLQDYADEWSNVSSKLNNAIEDQRAAEILGANWEEDILAQRLDILRNFTDQYVSLQQQQKDAYLKAREAEVNGGVNTTGGNISSSASSNSNNTSTPVTNKTPAASTPVKYHVGGKAFNTPTEAQAYLQAGAGSAYTSAYEAEKRRLQNVSMPSSAKESQAKYKGQQAREEYLKNNQIRAYSTGTEGAERGDAIVGEFDPEIVLNNDGTASIIDKPTLLNLKGGETIFNGEQTKKILKGYTSLEDKDPKRFKMLNAFANGTNTSFQNAFANRGLSLAGIGNGLMYNTNNVGQTVNNVFNVSLPNIHDGSKAADLFKEFEHLSMKATQFFNK